MKKALLVFIFLLLVPPALSAGDKGVWVESTGNAQMGELDTQKEVKARARRDAETRAIEKAVGSFISSHTLVSNNQVAEDLVYAAVRGRIENIEVLSEGWDEKDRSVYHVKIKALVEPCYPDKARGPALKVSLSKSTLKQGEETKILYQSDRDCYVYIFSIAADGSVTLLLPDSMHKDNHVLSDTAYEFPPAGSPIRLQAMFLPGFTGASAMERVKIIATGNQEPIVPLGFQEGMFTVYDAKSTGMINDLVRKLNQLDPADWTEATTEYRIIR